MDFQQIWQTVQGWLTNTGIKVVISIVIMIVSFTLINWLAKIVAKKGKKLEDSKRVDKTLYRTLSYVIKIGLKVLIVIGIIGYLGIDTSGMTALIASLGVGVGLAVNGTLSNLAGGALLLITRPFKDDDYIEACGYEGTVEAILICNTKLRTSDNKVVYLPNGKLSTSEIVNYSEKDTRRVDVTYSISYTDDLERAKSIIMDIVAKHDKILDEPKASVRMSGQSARSIDLTCKAWCKTDDYWDVKFDMMEQVKLAFDEQGITVPREQVDVHLKND